MIDRDAEPGLTLDERAALWAWADPTVPNDFADRVMRAVRDEDSSEDTRPSLELPISRPSRMRTRAIAAVFALAAAVLVLWMASSKQSFAREAEGVAGTVISSLERVEIREAVAKSCLPCHGSLHAGASRDALRAFDIDRPNGWEMLTDEQYAALRDRLAVELPGQRGIAAFMHE